MILDKSLNLSEGISLPLKRVNFLSMGASDPSYEKFQILTALFVGYERDLSRIEIGGKVSLTQLHSSPTCSLSSTIQVGLHSKHPCKANIIR